MSDGLKRIYWDTGCFICFLNKDEKERGDICDDVLKHAQAGEFEIWISMWVIVEVIRPRRRGTAPLPAWAEKAINAVPEAQGPLEELWQRYQRNNPTAKLTPTQISQIQAMFEWPFIKKVQVDELVARKAVEYSRDYNLGSGDAVHAATAVLWKCEKIQRWDKDYSKVSHLIPSEEPKRLSDQKPLIPMREFAPSPEDVEDKTNGETKQETVAPAANIPGSGSRAAESEATSETQKPASKDEKA